MSATAKQVEGKERPILFSGPMVRAILEGRKTQTRRVVTFPEHSRDPDTAWIKSVHQDGGGNWIAWSTDAHTTANFTKKAYPNGEGFPCPYGKRGDRLWVRETFYAFGYFRYTGNLTESGKREVEFVDTTLDLGHAYLMVATDPAPVTLQKDKFAHGWHKRPSIFMPRIASRVTLGITSVRVERLQEISEADAHAEGVVPIPCEPASIVFNTWKAQFRFRDAFRQGWDSINAKRGYSWDSNPYVWVIEFKKL